MRPMISNAGRLLAVAAVASTLAGCVSGGRGQVASLEGYSPDPALKTASKSNLKGRVSHACVVTQTRLRNVAEAALAQPCGCYADRTLNSLSSDEIQSYRATGYFNDSAKVKALNALDSCQLPRPV